MSATYHVPKGTVVVTQSKVGKWRTHILHCNLSFESKRIIRVIQVDVRSDDIYCFSGLDGHYDWYIRARDATIKTF